MRLKNRILASILILLLCASCILSGCNSQRKSREDSLKHLLENFSDALSDTNLCGMEIYAYYKEGPFFTYGPYGVDDLIREIEAGFREQGQKVYIGNEELKNNIDLLEEISKQKFIPILESNCRKDIRSCFIFQTNDNSQVLEIAFGGYSSVEDCAVMFVNGFHVEYDEIYLKLVNTFCPDYDFS